MGGIGDLFSGLGWLYLFGAGYTIVLLSRHWREFWDDTISVRDRQLAGGVAFFQNGETAQFNPGTITSVDVNMGNGTDGVNVVSTPTGVPVFDLSVPVFLLYRISQ